MIWFSCFVVCVFLCFGFLVAAGFLLFCRNSTSFPVSPHITSGEQRNSKATPLHIRSQEYQINHHPNAKTKCLAVRLASGASRTALSSWRTVTVIGGSSGAQRCDMVVVEKSGEEHLCAEAC